MVGLGVEYFCGERQRKLLLLGDEMAVGRPTTICGEGEVLKIV